MIYIKKIKSSQNVYILADKTKNIYESSPENYNKIVKENVTKTYKLAEHDVLEDINFELQQIANNLSIGDRIETMTSKEAFTTIKDHKENFKTNPKCHLINPAKSELGKTSKNILDDINSKIRDATGLKQWKNSLSAIDWFENIKNKPSYTFLSFDIAEFYPSITEDLVNKANLWARKLVTISEKQIKIIKRARKSVLFNNGKT